MIFLNIVISINVELRNKDLQNEKGNKNMFKLNRIKTS